MLAERIQARVAAMPPAERSSAVWRSMRRLADDEASGHVVVTYFAICARLRTEGFTRVGICEIASAVGCTPDELADLITELVERRAIVLASVDEELGVIIAVPVLDTDNRRQSGLMH